MATSGQGTLRGECESIGCSANLRLFPGFSNRFSYRDRLAEVRGAIRIPGKGLDTRRAKIATALIGTGIGVIDDPVLSTIGRTEKPIMSRPVDVSLRICTQERMIELRPASGIEQIVANICLQDPEGRRSQSNSRMPKRR